MSALPGVDGVTAAVALGGRVMVDSLPGLPHIYRMPSLLRISA
jgi:hypothetical protein